MEPKSNTEVEVKVEAKAETEENTQDIIFNKEIKRLDQNISLIQKLLEHTHTGYYYKLKWISSSANEICNITACICLSAATATSTIIYCCGIIMFTYSFYKDR